MKVTYWTILHSKMAATFVSPYVLNVFHKGSTTLPSTNQPLPSKNPTIFYLLCWLTWTNDSSTKCLMFQALFSFKFLIDWGHSKLFIFYFCKVIKEIKLKRFLERILQELMKKKYFEHQMLGQWVVCSINPAYYIEDWRILSSCV